jgi:hypothetical protein
VVENSGRAWYLKTMQGNHRHIVAILMGGLRPYRGRAAAPRGRQTRRKERAAVRILQAGTHTLQNEPKFGRFYCEFRGTYTPSGVKKRERGIQIFSEIRHFMVKTAFMSHHGLFSCCKI